MPAWKRFKKNKLAVVSLVFLCLISMMAVFAPVITTYSYDEQNIEQRLETPSRQYWMGTDMLGRDLYSRVLYGARMSIAVGVCTALFSLVVGTLLGALAGYRGGWTDHLVMRGVDLFYIFPSLLFAIILMMFLGRGFVGIILALGATAWVTQARLVRAQVLQARELAYVEAARAMGVRSIPIIFRHILPNLWGPIIVSLTMQIPSNIMAESFLSFIGLGLQPPFSSWGTLANEGFRAMRSYPHLIIFPGTILFVTMLAFNYLGDGLRDVLDPHNREGVIS
ncbi:MAG TPA: peptide ABC transporter permease [Bdellovibrionales bacterium]|nr:MAG: peptide ABC transporter permease [Bdellovibrionales bacterium GWB1_52_6]OFZ04875.1 MAG: peptide ABC transporter permease [Bdellovibrionales bacterium GWA1_52_35]OFZ42321.1 MAG: peptide ABC transporter permease [Bdellovibrionales bacterium GWC1_52_8]HAR41965.1 peptide ABC transporter permease [Bdellovibrionales bacterium]HCM38961.1 peptide ABC transporter permease [Bdellovibrionales bacterium]